MVLFCKRSALSGSDGGKVAIMGSWRRASLNLSVARRGRGSRDGWGYARGHCVGLHEERRIPMRQVACLKGTEKRNQMVKDDGNIISGKRCGNRVAIYKDMRDGRSFCMRTYRFLTYHDIRALAVIASRYFSPPTSLDKNEKNPHSTPYKGAFPEIVGQNYAKGDDVLIEEADGDSPKPPTSAM